MIKHVIQQIQSETKRMVNQAGIQESEDPSDDLNREPSREQSDVPRVEPRLVN